VPILWGMGRPLKLTAKLREAIAKRVRGGNYPEVAAQCEGIARSTFYLWQSQGRADQAAGKETEFSEFLDAIARSRAECEAELLEQVRKAVDKQGNAKDAKWLLERRSPERWGRRVDFKLEERAIEEVLARLSMKLDWTSYIKVLEVLGAAELPFDP